MAIGIGASTALVGQINAVFWKPLPVSAPQQLRSIAWTSPRHPFLIGPNVWPGPRINGQDTFGSSSYPAYVALRDQTRAFSDLACWSDLGESRPVVLGELGFASAQFVSGNFFRALGARAAVGRTIQPEDDGPGNWSPVAMISDRFWTRVFGRDPDVTRQTLRINGRPFTVVGVMPADFFGFDLSVSPDVLVPHSAVQTSRQPPTRCRTRVCGISVALSGGCAKASRKKKPAAAATTAAVLRGCRQAPASTAGRDSGIG